MKSYFVNKNCHYSNFIPRISYVRNCNTIISSGTFIFTDSCRYDIEEKSCVNKLFGFSLGLFNVHKHSYRFGWTYNNEKDVIDIWVYYYNKGKLYKNKIYEAELNSPISLEINTYKDTEKKLITNYFIVGDKIFSVTVLNDIKYWFLLTLGLYFGGKTRAPHKIEVKKYDFLEKNTKKM